MRREIQWSERKAADGEGRRQRGVRFDWYFGPVFEQIGPRVVAVMMWAE